LKVLIIRFSSIGDVVLTTPIVRCLKTQKNATVHYLIKEKFKEVIQENPNIDKVFIYKKGVLKKLSKEKYDYIIDLQNNFNSYKIKTRLKHIKKLTVNKENIKKWLLVNIGVDLLKKQHIVDRYFKTIKSLNISNDKKGLDFFIKSSSEIDKNILSIDLNKPYIAWAVGASYKNKIISAKQIIKVCNQLNEPVVLLGGKQDFLFAQKVIVETKNKQVYNLCGKLTLNESAFMVKKSSIVLTNDTGLMHIASAFKKKIISFWGCTKPSLGMYPYLADPQSKELVFNSQKRPCSKLGNRCRYSKKGCIINIKSNAIFKEIQKAL
tara:strand:- start:121 stop:1086 length:966 start_codon:yes stop_codon:yes gene_type:complete